MIPSVELHEYGTGDMLFLQKGKDASLAAELLGRQQQPEAIYLGLDELLVGHRWRTICDFEFGFGVGIGVIFGTSQRLGLRRLRTDRSRRATASTTRECQAVGDSSPGLDGLHQSTRTRARRSAKVGGYTEPNWFNGGSVPVIFPHISFPQLGLRYKPIKQFEARLGLGFSLTGFWFGLSGDYGLEKPTRAPPPTRSRRTSRKTRKRRPIPTKRRARRRCRVPLARYARSR